MRAVYDSDCEYFAFNSHREEWTTWMRNVDGPGDELWLWMKTVERIPRLTIYYKGAAAQAWAATRKTPEQHR